MHQTYQRVYKGYKSTMREIKVSQIVCLGIIERSKTLEFYGLFNPLRGLPSGGSSFNRLGPRLTRWFRRTISLYTRAFRVRTHRGLFTKKDTSCLRYLCILIHHQGFEQLSKSESIEKWRFDTLPDSSVSTSVSILVSVAVGAYMVENYLLNK